MQSYAVLKPPRRWGNWSPNAIAPTQNAGAGRRHSRRGMEEAQHYGGLPGPCMQHCRSAWRRPREQGLVNCKTKSDEVRQELRTPSLLPCRRLSTSLSCSGLIARALPGAAPAPDARPGLTPATLLAPSGVPSLKPAAGAEPTGVAAADEANAKPPPPDMDTPVPAPVLPVPAGVAGFCATPPGRSPVPNGMDLSTPLGTSMLAGPEGCACPALDSPLEARRV